MHWYSTAALCAHAWCFVVLGGVVPSSVKDKVRVRLLCLRPPPYGKCYLDARPLSSSEMKHPENVVGRRKLDLTPRLKAPPSFKLLIL